MNKKVVINHLDFKFPEKPVTMFFSTENDERHISDKLANSRQMPIKAISLFAGVGGFDPNLKPLYVSYTIQLEGFEPVEIDFTKEENATFVRRYYRHMLKKILAKHDDLMFTKSGITDDLQVWKCSNDEVKTVKYKGNDVRLWPIDRFTLKVRYDSFNQCPYIMVTCDRPTLLFNAPLSELLEDDGSPLEQTNDRITADMLRLVMTRREITDKNGKKRIRRSIESLKRLQEHNVRYDPATTRAFMTGKLKQRLGLDREPPKRSDESRYVKYLQKIIDFKDKYLIDTELREVFIDLDTNFRQVNPLQVGQVDESKRMLMFGGGEKNLRQQAGINHGPARISPHTVVKLIAIYPKSLRSEASQLLGSFRNGNYPDYIRQTSGKDVGSLVQKRLSHYLGTQVAYADKVLHIEFSNEANPLPEIQARLQDEHYRNLDHNVTHIGIYVTPIAKYASEKSQKMVYYKVKEAFLNLGIPTQCIEAKKMTVAIDNDKKRGKLNFIYTLQNMAVAMCAKLGGMPWLLDETKKNDLVIGIGAFRSDDNTQYIGAAFSFDNTGAFNSYRYFAKKQVRELMGSIEEALLEYASINNKPERLIIHYYKQVSRKNEFQPIEDMLHNLGLDIPVYIITINKTESEDVLAFDLDSTYRDYRGNTVQSLMPYSGTYINLGKTREGRYRYLLYNNTRYGNDKFSPTDGFPFPIKLTINSNAKAGEPDSQTIRSLVGQVYQFSRIYWKSVRQQGLPVTVSYTSMIAEIMPHFDNKMIYIDDDCLWFL